MKKLIISVLCIIVLNNSISVLASMDLALMEKNAIFEVEPERKDLPGSNEVNKLYEGMLLTDAVNIMGNPQGAYSGISCLIYSLRNGQSLYLYYYANEDSIEYVYDINMEGWPYKLVTAIILAAIIVLVSVIVVFRLRKKKYQPEIKRQSL